MNWQSDFEKATGRKCKSLALSIRDSTFALHLFLDIWRMSFVTKCDKVQFITEEPVELERGRRALTHLLEQKGDHFTRLNWARV